jgi:hypothetical protein
MALILIELILELNLEIMPERPFVLANLDISHYKILSEATIQGKEAEAIGFSIVRF